MVESLVLHVGIQLTNCHNNCEIVTKDLTNVNNKIGLVIGHGGEKIDGSKCSSSNCSSLKYNDIGAWSEFDGDTSGLLLQENEKDMQNILDVLGENFKMGLSGYPILTWQTK